MKIYNSTLTTKYQSNQNPCDIMDLAKLQDTTRVIMDIITQIAFNEIVQHFLSQWRNETMIALFCTIVFVFIVKRQSEHYEKIITGQNKIIQEQLEHLEQTGKRLNKLNQSLEFIYEKIKNEKITAELKAYVDNSLKNLLRDLNNKK